MKTQKNMIKAITVLTVGFMLMGCDAPKANKTSSEAPPIVVPNGPYVPPGNGPGQGSGVANEYGGVATLNVANLARFQAYTGRAMYSPQDVQVNLNLIKFNPGYGGTVSITYKDNCNNGSCTNYAGYFTSGSGDVNTKYNVKHDWDGDGIAEWHGFFEDFYGALVVTLEVQPDVLGDGGAATIEGKIYFKNFAFTYAPHPPTHCWFVSLGPYDCRAWPTGKGTKSAVNTYQALAPDNGYQLLGTFTGMNLTKAFNGEF